MYVCESSLLQLYGVRDQGDVPIRTEVYENTVCSRVVDTEQRTAMCIHLTIHLGYGALQDLPVCVSIVWRLYGVRGQGAIQIRTNGIRKCCLERSGPNGEVK